LLRAATPPWHSDKLAVWTIALIAMTKMAIAAIV
jgi:hypothetical protein